MFGYGEGDYGHDVYEHGTQGEYMTAAVAEYAREHGRDRPDQAWIASPFDTWEPNPFYTGPKVPHPESDEFETYEGPVAEDRSPFAGQDLPGDDEIPF